MAVKRYRIADFEETFAVVVEVDDAIMTEAQLNELNRFWGGAEARLMEARGDITRAALKLLWTALWWAQARYGNLNLDGMLDLFARSNVEGWPPMDGTFGIKLIAVDELEPPDTYYSTVTEVAIPENQGSGVPA